MQASRIRRAQTGGYAFQKWLRLTTVMLLGTLLSLLTPSMSHPAANDPLGELVQAAGFEHWKQWWLKPAEDFTYPDVRSGMKLSLIHDFAGKVVLINFWATWCPPCRREMPSLQALYDEFKDDGLVVLGVNVLELGGGRASKNIAERLHLTFPMMEGARYGPPSYDVSRIPLTYLMDRKGRLIGKRQGAQDWIKPSAKALLKFLLAEDG